MPKREVVVLNKLQATGAIKKVEDSQRLDPKDVDDDTRDLMIAQETIEKEEKEEVKVTEQPGKVERVVSLQKTKINPLILE